MGQTLRQRFGTIRWKLTASYAAVTVLVMLIMEAILVFALGLYITRVFFVPETIAEASRDLGKLLQIEFAATDRSAAELERQLHELVEVDAADDRLFQIDIDFPEEVPEEPATGGQADIPAAWQVPVITLLTSEGRVLTSTLHSYTPGIPLVSLEPPVAGTLIDRAAAGTTDTELLSAWTAPGNQLIGAAPVFNRQNEVVGIVYARLQRPPINDLVEDIPTILLVSAVPFLLISGLIGLVFGLFAGRDFSRRLKRLSEASAALASGDLSQRVEDVSVDEIGQLSSQFNTMSEQLAENLRALRLLADKNAQLAEQAAQLATVEERNRLARELHDSVSQDLFSLTMLSAAARRLIERKPAVVANQLTEIQETSQRALQETRSLIFALRPALLDGRGLGPALHDLISAARERQGLDVTMQISEERHLPLEHEQALFRIVQEALANVVRHSGVRTASVTLGYEDTQVTLTVRDPGHGFDTSAPRSARSIGLTTMAERTAALGGSFAIESIPEQGTCVTVTLPAPFPAHKKENSNEF
jgi:signal transduction histidine kinase